MRTFVVIISISALVLGRPDENLATINMAHNECQSNPRTYVDEDILDRISGGEKIDNPSVRAHILCVTTKLGVLNEYGEVNRTNLRTVLSRVILNEEKLEENLEKCAVEETDAEEVALVLDKCFWNNLDHDHNSHIHYHHQKT
uniref:Odorant binding protein 10 n=1 Tax=Anoplophora glabripennis TaxID=217634 RepID=A0A1W5XGJ8_ANOGL|nr:odorant binding protein 10 [Anoplophora glabripennis]